jgi:tRNA (cytidine/uridine-2'-O-)-methyltransferase
VSQVLHVALFKPEIHPNAGNIARLCAANGLPLHLVGALGFRIDDRSIRRAGLDYWPFVDLRRETDLEELKAILPEYRIQGQRLPGIWPRVHRPFQGVTEAKLGSNFENTNVNAPRKKSESSRSSCNRRLRSTAPINPLFSRGFVARRGDGHGYIQRNRPQVR